LARQDRAERTRNAILDAAAEVFDERGFNGASLSDILARAGVTKGALYFHFSSKEELARVIIEEQWAWELPPIDESRAIQTLIDLTHNFAHHLATNSRVRASNRLVTEANFTAPAPQVYTRWLEIVHDMLKIAHARGDLKKEWDIDKVSLWLGGAFVGIQTMSEVLTGRQDIHERVTDLWEISLPGLVPPRRLSRLNPAGTVKWDTTGAA
jgi:AcrR family transcriptional regulator